MFSAFEPFNYQGADGEFPIVFSQIFVDVNFFNSFISNFDIILDKTQFRQNLS